MIRSTSQLAELRASLREDVADPGDEDTVVENFVAAVNEVVTAVVTRSGSGGQSVDVRWRRRAHPCVELYAEIRSLNGTPESLMIDGLPTRLLHHYAERVDIDERIGGSVIIVRSRV